ncbi:MAG TPA: HNH endonuclease signature motif containing protein [Pyrinomonadaceae bacterium]|nr:HNH endonuclease signature motif containing protein [Pyrinomonadaceae bacterium]
MANNVNLDALIPRADFDTMENTSQSEPPRTMQIRDLEGGSFFYDVLRKPDFQRETASWSSRKIKDFVKTFVNGDLIPALILWRSQGGTFAIDGAHRLSALIAWVNDDYGDGELSRQFFTHVIAPEQAKVAERTRRLINKEIGSYKDHQFAIKFPEKSKPDVLARAKMLGQVSVTLQWVTGDSKKAEASFFKINQEAVPIDRTELKLLKSRNKPNALAARAIIRAGTGHKYWSKFAEEKKQLIESLAKEIHENLFTPILSIPIKTLDLPVAGQSYSSQTLPLVFELVNLANESDSQTKPSVDDSSGDDTIKYLKTVRRISYRMSGTHPSSLGLHPIVYFYSTEGRFQPTSFLAVIGLLKDFEREDLYATFTKHRKVFEEFLLKYKSFANQVTTKWGSGSKGSDHLKTLYRLILDKIVAGKSEAKVLELLQGHDVFRFLTPLTSLKEPVGADFTTETKSQAFLRDAVETPVRCGICGARLHTKSITIDHVTRKADGGQGELENAQTAHPYCNTTYKH